MHDLYSSNDDKKISAVITVEEYRKWANFTITHDMTMQTAFWRYIHDVSLQIILN